MMNDDGTDQTLDQSESLDSDELRNDDGDSTVEPPDHWSEADKFGTTPEEALQGESLDEKLSEEEPDVPLENDERAVSETPDAELTEDLVDKEILESDEDPDIDYADGQRQAEIIEGTLVEDRGRDRGQIDGTPEDGGPVE
ncbi:hypothetical protein HQ346_02555 [Rhodococcus sp. BP-252]|uniref:DUF5709 domain-containing protein n=1 Tax=Rhodococcoides kyotonense TaxID=398843 RepID=A0A177Y6J9_9NOCA|nr:MULTISPECIES: hypothetical protein [Rhodococcus]MBY6410434.1 hypothetical protein [Rhodococcus sp. BP-320]MBY6416316.1 hypothetical protein [Rhodococcus sp. BP-321]MBY6420311.1 hypothetical protein [Rhodococcus sp. BP-324]MBY6424990.1 hypothetical protein [Rhodococcus sp. BP-323]MBY6430304.1 hypothetical protein [Rhodococcus sp. BP-322]